MCYKFKMAGWLADSDPAAAAQGCGRSFEEGINAFDLEQAKQLAKEKYPTLIVKAIRCPALDLDIEC